MQHGQSLPQVVSSHDLVRLALLCVALLIVGGRVIRDMSKCNEWAFYINMNMCMCRQTNTQTCKLIVSVGVHTYAYTHRYRCGHMYRATLTLGLHVLMYTPIAIDVFVCVYVCIGRHVYA